VIRLPFHLKVNTDFSLMVGMEAYGGFALYYWLAAAPGLRSRTFAMWSAIGALVLSLIGQIAYHVMAAEHIARPPAGVVGFVSALPVVVLGFAAILVHLVHLDRADAVKLERDAAEAQRLAAEESAVTDERVALRAGLEAERVARQAAEERATVAEQAANEAAEKAAILARKLAAKTPQRGRKRTPQNSRSRTPQGAPATEVPKDIDARAEALAILAAEPGISGAKLAERVGKSERWGQMFRNEMTAKVAPTDTVDGNGGES
jgi:hypothetical protein